MWNASRRRLLSLAAGLGLAAALACTPDRCAEGVAECDGTLARTCLDVTDGELSSHREWHEERCEPAAACRVVGGPYGQVALCSRGDDTDPLCGGLGAATRCDGSTLVTCRLGVRTATRTCAGRCMRPAGCDRAFCADLPEPDPACAESSELRPVTLCVDSARIAWCQCGYRTETHACSSPGPRCVLLGPGLAGCRP